MLTRYFTVLIENGVPGNSGPVSLDVLVARTKYDLTAVIVRERGVYTMNEPNFVIDIRNRSTHAVLREIPLHYDPRR